MSINVNDTFSLSVANKQPCYSGGPATLICKAVIDETHDCKTFVFEDSLSRSFDFKPGQYLSFKFSIGAKVLPRAYSVSSTPTRPHNVQITVKRVDGGIVSNWLNDVLRPGMRVEISNIGGAFNYLDIPANKPLFLSGGSGVTPVMSMLQYITDVAEQRDVVFVHFSRSPKDIIFRDQLEFIAKRYTNVKIHLFVQDLGNDEGYSGSIGRITPCLMKQFVPDISEREVFMCGPEGFMKAARLIATEINISKLHEESFGEKIIFEQGDHSGGEVYFIQSGNKISCDAGETLLQAAMNAGIWIESSCQQGVCGSCKVKMTHGEVCMENLGGLSEDDKTQGYVLACCARPIGSISIDL